MVWRYSNPRSDGAWAACVDPLPLELPLSSGDNAVYFEQERPLSCWENRGICLINIMST